MTSTQHNTTAYTSLYSSAWHATQRLHCKAGERGAAPEYAAAQEGGCAVNQHRHRWIHQELQMPPSVLYQPQAPTSLPAQTAGAKAACDVLHCPSAVRYPMHGTGNQARHMPGVCSGVADPHAPSNPHNDPPPLPFPHPGIHHRKGCGICFGISDISGPCNTTSLVSQGI